MAGASCRHFSRRVVMYWDFLRARRVTKKNMAHAMHCIDGMSHVVFFNHKPIWIAALMSNVAQKILHSSTGSL